MPHLRWAVQFLSTPSARRATSYQTRLKCYEAEFLSTPSARRATSGIDSLARKVKISIHALREEGDRRRWRCWRGWNISIHALREEGDSKLADKIGIIIS